MFRNENAFGLTTCSRVWPARLGPSAMIVQEKPYRGTSLIRNSPPPRATMGPCLLEGLGGARFLMSEVPLFEGLGLTTCSRVWPARLGSSAMIAAYLSPASFSRPSACSAATCQKLTVQRQNLAKIDSSPPQVDSTPDSSPTNVDSSPKVDTYPPCDRGVLVPRLFFSAPARAARQPAINQQLTVQKKLTVQHRKKLIDQHHHRQLWASSPLFPAYFSWFCC